MFSTKPFALVVAILSPIVAGTPAQAEQKRLICDYRTADMYATFRLDFEVLASGKLVGTATSTLDFRGRMSGSLGKNEPAIYHAVNGDDDRFVLKNLRTGTITVIDRNTGIGETGGSAIRCRTSPPRL